MQKHVRIRKITFYDNPSENKPRVSEINLDYSLDTIFLGLSDEKLENVLINLDFSKLRDSSTALRKKLYAEGYDLDIEGEKLHYVRYKRTASSARKGNCLFILEDKFDEASRWSDAGLSVAGEDGVLANLEGPNRIAYEAYQALTLSGLADDAATFELSPKNILFVEDFVSEFPCCEAVYVRKSNDDRPGKCLFEIGGYKVVQTDEESGGIGAVRNLIWDGESLLDESVFNEDIEIDGKHPYKGKGMILLRNRFFKTCAFNAKIRKWFEEQGVSLDDKVDQSKFKGCYTEAQTYRDIKMITTFSSLKYLKFFKKEDAIYAIKKWIKVTENDRFGIVKTDKETRYYNGEKVKLSYQIFNTLMLGKSEVEKLANQHIDFLKRIASDSQELLNFYGQSKLSAPDDEIAIGDYRFRKTVIERLLMHNKDFEKTALYKHYIHDLIMSLKDQGKEGGILVHGTNAFLLSNPIELLAFATKALGFAINTGFDPEKRGFDDTVYCKHFENGKWIVAARSPHIIMGNFYKTQNWFRKEYTDYLNLTDEIVVVNAINNNMMNRLQGCDFDSDFVLMTDEPIIVESFNRFFIHDFEPYKKFVVPVEDLKPEKKNSETNLEDVDNRICNNLIGVITDLSQRVNSVFWDRYTKLQRGEIKENEIDELGKLYYANSILSVLVGLEIDAAKKGYETNANKVIDEIKKTLLAKYSNLPEFFRVVGDKEKKEQRKREQGKFHLADETWDINIIGSTLYQNRIYEYNGEYHYDNSYKHLKMPKKGWELLSNPNGFYLKMFVVSKKKTYKTKAGTKEKIALSGYAIVLDETDLTEEMKPISDVQDVISDESKPKTKLFYVKVNKGLKPRKQNYAHYDTPMDFLFESIDRVKADEIYRGGDEDQSIYISDLYVPGIKQMRLSGKPSESATKILKLANELAEALKNHKTDEVSKKDEELSKYFLDESMKTDDYLYLLNEIDSSIKKGYQNVRNYHYVLLHYILFLQRRGKLSTIFEYRPSKTF